MEKLNLREISKISLGKICILISIWEHAWDRNLYHFLFPTILSYIIVQ